MDEFETGKDLCVDDRREPETKSSFARAFNCIFSRHMLNVSVLILVAVLLTGMLQKPAWELEDWDLWWHLADARILLTTHHFIHIEPYSFTVAGQRWINPEWLSEIPYWIGYKSIGLTGIYLVTLGGLVANLLVLYWRSCLVSRHAVAAFWMSALGFALMTINEGPRTIILAYLALSIEMAILEACERGNSRLLWLLPPIFCVWINMHGSAILGLCLLALYILCGCFPFKKGIFDQNRWSASEFRRLLIVFLASAAALFINPYGWRLVWNPFDMLLNQKLMISIMQEWQPMDLSMNIGKASVIAIGLTIVANCIHSRKWKVYELAFILYAWYTAFAHIRFAFLAAVLTIPMLAKDMARSFFGEPDKKTIPAINALFAAIAICAVVYLFPAESTLQQGLAAKYPMQIIASIQPSWRIYNEDSTGGMMALESKPHFFDTRDDTFEKHGVMQDLLSIMSLRQPLELLDKYRIDHALTHANSALAYLLERTPGWRIEKAEGTGNDAYLLFARSNSIIGAQASGTELSQGVRH
jgi:hypothetical protein